MIVRPIGGPPKGHIRITSTFGKSSQYRHQRAQFDKFSRIFHQFSPEIHAPIRCAFSQILITFNLDTIFPESDARSPYTKPEQKNEEGNFSFLFCISLEQRVQVTCGIPQERSDAEKFVVETALLGNLPIRMADFGPMPF